MKIRTIILVISCFIIFSCKSKKDNINGNNLEKKRVEILSALSDDGVEVHYTKYGNQKEVIVFVHGWSCDQTYWQEQVDFFKKDFQVITIDLGGHGKSTLGNRKDWTIPSFSKDVLAVIKELPYEKLNLVGHSLGSMVVLETAAQLSPKTTTVICVDFLKDKLKPLPQETAKRQMQAMKTAFEPIVRGFVGSMFREDADSTLKNWIINDMVAAPPEVAVSASMDLVTRDYQTTIDAIVEKNIPRFIINADSRPINTDYLKKLGFEPVVIEKTGHFLMMEKPIIFNEQLNSLLK